MNKFIIFSVIILLFWGITPISIFYSTPDSAESCSHSPDKKDYDLKIVLYLSVYSTLFLSFLLIFLISFNLQSKIFGVLFSLIFLTNIATGTILLFSYIFQISFFKNCSRKILIISGFTSLIPELFCIILLLFAVVIVVFSLDILLIKFKKNVIHPIITFNIKKLCFLGLFIWSALNIWSIIVFSRDRVVVGIGVFQIFLSIITLIVMKKYYEKLKYCLNILVLMSISIYFFEIFGSEHGLTQCGIISFSSVGFYPSFFAMKKCKKIYKIYMTDRSLQPQLMPTEPPAICASGEVELYKSIYNTSGHLKRRSFTIPN